MPTPEENHAAAMSRAWIARQKDALTVAYLGEMLLLELQQRDGSMSVRETLLNLRAWGGGGADAPGSRAFTDLQVQKKITVGPDRIVRLLKSEQSVS